jgi:hypothetical protein
MLMSGMRIRLNSIAGISLLFLIACSSPRELDPAAYMEYIQAHGNAILTNTKSLNGVQYTVQYLPLEYMVLNNSFRGNAELDKKKFMQELDSSQGTLFFRMIIKDEATAMKVRNFVLEKEKYASALEYSNSGLMSNIRLSVGSNTLSCVMCHLEPPSSIRPELRVAFEFDVSGINLEPAEDFILTLDDRLLDNGLIKFRFKRKELNQLPKLKLT